MCSILFLTLEILFLAQPLSRALACSISKRKWCSLKLEPWKSRLISENISCHSWYLKFPCPWSLGLPQLIISSQLHYPPWTRQFFVRFHPFHGCPQEIAVLGAAPCLLFATFRRSINVLLPGFQTERTCTLSPCDWIKDQLPCGRKDGIQQSMGMLIRLQAAFWAFGSFFLVKYRHWSAASCDPQKGSSRNLRWDWMLRFIKRCKTFLPCSPLLAQPMRVKLSDQSQFYTESLSCWESSTLKSEALKGLHWEANSLEMYFFSLRKFLH